MFKVNKLTDYAMVLLLEMARGSTVRSTQHVSDRTGIPLPTVAKIMKSLGKAGLVQSQRGAGGGYALGRRPIEITVADVIQAVEGPIALTACAETSDEHCSIEAVCPVQGKWNRVNRAVRAALTEVTLADMAEDIPTFGPAPRAKEEPRAATALLAPVK